MTDSRPGDFKGRSLLAVFAHPDDESLAAGGLLACCAAGGARVALLCLSRGESGTGEPDPDLPDLASTRARELHCAARALGVAEVMLVPHPDGMLPWLDDGVLASDIREVIDRTSPNVVVTFGDDGLYWHPDHIAVHEATRAAVASLRARGPALYYVTMPPGQMRAVAETAERRRALASGPQPPPRYDVLGVADLDAFGASAQPPTLVVRTGPHARQKLAALRCHRTQAAAGPFDYLTDEDAEALIGEEHYRRAEVGATGPAFIDCLGAPLEAS